MFTLLRSSVTNPNWGSFFIGYFPHYVIAFSLSLVDLYLIDDTYRTNALAKNSGF
jgi:hypothetical protein